MRTLIVGIGALGGTIATRALAAGMPVSLATRTPESARRLRDSGLRVSGVGGAAAASSFPVAPLSEYRGQGGFELVLLATKAHDALEVAPLLPDLLAPGGTVLSIQNGGLSELLFERLGGAILLGGISNLGATMLEPGAYEQRNAGHLLVGELAGGSSERATRVAQALAAAIETRVTQNLRAAIWAKLLLNCSVTTIGAIAGRTMREYMSAAAGREVFRRAYDEALSVALASGTRPLRMIVEPVPPGWQEGSAPGPEYDAWIDRILTAYGDLKPSMLQDFERGRRTEVDFINGYVSRLGAQLGVPVPINAAIAAIVHLVEEKQLAPDPARLDDVLQTGSRG